ncbi:PTS system protein [Klebsiella michiganensis]|nr:PTS system protein [Klebsiella michiganensis]
MHPPAGRGAGDDPQRLSAAIPLLVVMLSISVINALLLQSTGRILPELISEAVRPLVVASDTLTAVLISLFICNLLLVCRHFTAR